MCSRIPRSKKEKYCISSDLRWHGLYVYETVIFYIIKKEKRVCAIGGGLI